MVNPKQQSKRIASQCSEKKRLTHPLGLAEIDTRELGSATQFLLNAQKLVVLGSALCFSSTVY